ncbi:MAG TPA: 23S rRNA (cytidine(2498)-2'-O)-methyltransferase RlmM [Gammaproteobacteria bacterium]|nr:23S rRNA (cytidine(2498)-2'-O)-methyltransferase RlmM [Gammaproteobacteria bacterium]
MHAMEAHPEIRILQCRPGFEADCAAEAGMGSAIVAEGIVSVTSSAENWPPLSELVFARQAFRQVAELTALPQGDRINPILAALEGHAGSISALLLEHPDTNSGKEIAGFLRKFTPALTSALAKRGFRLERGAARRLHLLFSDSRHLRLGFSVGAEGSPLVNGILHLKMPRDAPSRSTLKLEEALLTFLDERERERWLKPGLTAVDLGAAPGGWTWQLAHRGLRVTAVDNGAMQEELMATGRVEHRREDGFRYRPRRPVDWLLCDMVEQPQRIAALMADWLVRGDCRRAVFNLKLPMKRRHDHLRECLGLLQERLDAAGLDHELACKQLYHDREEATAFAALR